jgi:hypothetical protein
LDILTGLGIDNTDDEETSVPAIRAQLAGLDQPETTKPGRPAPPAEA